MAFWIFIVVVAIYVAAAGYTDFRMQRIPNYLTVPMAIAGLVCSLICPALKLPGYPYPTDWLSCLLGFGLGFGIFIIPFLAGGGGSGDLKLVAALGAWLGWLYLLLAVMVSLVFALVLAGIAWTIGFSASGGKMRTAKTPVNSGASGPARPKARRRRAVPFAIPVAMGTWCILSVMVWKDLRPDMFQPSVGTVRAEQPR